MPHHNICRALAALSLLLCAGLAPCAAQADDERQYKVEAVFLYNFLNYITWPGYATPEDFKQATVCTRDGDPILPSLDYIRRHRTQEHSLRIRRIGSVDTVEGCDIVFLRDAEDGDVARWRTAATDKKVLFVSSAPDAMDNGSMIGLAQEGPRIAIDIDLTSLKQNDFQVSSRLLALARKVK